MSPKPPFLDDEERDIIESFEAELDSGSFRPNPPEARPKASAQWRAMVERASARKAITLRLQERDIERLKVIARERGLPYQTLVSSVLHQYASGTLVERG
jgi:hypothetical protein